MNSPFRISNHAKNKCFLFATRWSVAGPVAIFGVALFAEGIEARKGRFNSLKLAGSNFRQQFVSRTNPLTRQKNEADPLQCPSLYSPNVCK